MSEEGFISKELFYQLLDFDNAILLFFTKEDGWLGANRSFFDVTGLENIDAFRAKYESIRELFDSESEEVFTEMDKSWLDYIRIHKKEGYKVAIMSKNGELHYYNAICKMIKQKGTELYALELNDITELEEARRQTKEVERLKSKFLANIGHEFRTPMNGILGFIELLESSRPTEKQREYIHMVHTSSRNLMSNIESLLDLAQMQGGRLRLSSSEFNLVAEMEEMTKRFCAEGSDKGIAVSFFIDPKLPSHVEADLRKIKQILNNLLSNALKFTKRNGRILVEIKLLKRQTGGTCSIGFSVKDNGKGIPKNQLASITQPFMAGDQADNRLGVGLSLSHGLIKMLGGELKIQSEEGRGSVFAFALTLKCSNEQSFAMLGGKTVKVLLLDEKRIDDANLLTLYLRSFAVNVEKINVIDETLYQNCHIVYIIASQENSSWMMKIGTYQKRVPTVMLLNESERLQTRTAHVIDHFVNKPLVPSVISQHLVNIFKLPKDKTTKEVLQEEKIRALVVEDNLINQRLIKLLLQEYHLQVTTASDGDEAVNLCKQNHYHIIFMDIDMPVKDGIIATQEIKDQKDGRSESTPIIALTALAMEGDREHILDEGLDDYISKPLTREKLEHVLKKYLKLKVS